MACLDFEIGPTGRRFRRAVDQDKQDIEMFWKREETEYLFNVGDIGSLIELSPLAICMIDEDKEVTGFMSLCDHPNLPGLDPAAWEVWMRNMFQLFYLSHNTLFIHFACFKDCVSEYFMEEAFVSVFQNDSYLLHIVLVVPPNCPLECIEKFNVFKRRSVYKYCSAKQEEKDKESCYYLYVARRNEFCPSLKIRRAVEEDNDDIVEILDKTNKRLKDLYGEYYISEIIGRHPNMRRQILVAEIFDKVVGVMGLNQDIDYRKLQRQYELGPYHGLISVTPLEREHLRRSNEFMELIGEPIMHGQIDLFNPISRKVKKAPPIRPDDISELEAQGPEEPKELSNFRKESPPQSKVVFEDYKHESQVSDVSSDKLISPPELLSKFHDFSAVTLLDEENFDYEIINIDTQLLTTLESTLEFTFDDKKLETFDAPKVIEKYNQKRYSKMILERKLSTVNSPVNQKLSESMSGPELTGSPNAFMIELFGLRDDVDPRRSFNLLVAAFECMKTYDYCLIRVPCSGKSFPLLQHFCFVPTKENVCSQYSLYIAHRNSILGNFRVRRAELADIPQISALFINLDAKQTVYTVESAIACTKKKNKAYVLMCGLSIVGLGILQRPVQINAIRMLFTTDVYHHHKYHVEAQGVTSGFSTLKSVIVYPVFETHYRFFLRELMRLSGSSALLWLTTYRNKFIATRTNAAIPAMVPLLPRKSASKTCVATDIKKLVGSKKNSTPTFSAWLLSKRLTSIPKVTVDTRIVVVGASRTAMAFLNTLIFGESSTYLTFTNVTLVSRDGLPFVRKYAKETELMFLRYRTQTNKYLKSTPYGYYVNVVCGVMCQINRQENHIVLENGQRYSYDKLFLMIGRQFQHPDYLKALQEKEKDIKAGRIPKYVRLDVPRRIEREPLVTRYDTPENMFFINTATDASKALHYARGLYRRCHDVKVLVYGASIHSYCCLTALLEVIHADEIVFIEAFPPEDPTKARIPVFSNVKVDRTIRALLEDLKIQCYRGYHFKSFKKDEDENIITEVEFVSQTQVITLECSALFYYGKRGINTQAFVAVNKCGISYDGGIVIDHEFRTNDPAIYSAGPAARYRRRYCGDFQAHKFFDSYEVGDKLAIQIRDELDPLLSKRNKKPTVLQQPKRDSKKGSPASMFDSSRKSCDMSLEIPPYSLLPVFKKAIEWHCILPGGLQYLEIRSPGPKYPHQYVQTMDYVGFIMETYTNGYFKLHLSNDFVVDGITCLTPDRWSLEGIKNIYGLPCAMLNNVHLRYFTNRIHDLLDFFRSPWAIFLYHEYAPELISVAKEVLPVESSKTLAEALRAVAESFTGVDSILADLKEKLRENFERHQHVAAITDYVVQWLSDNDLLLPMYMRPWQKLEFDDDIQTRPLFLKRKRTLKIMLAYLTPMSH